MSVPSDDRAGASTAAYTTPTKRTAFAPSAQAGPSRARPAGASPAYSSRRHSLYGVEDRVVIDPGSRIWKIGFSGEPEPRAVFFSQDESDPTGAAEAWDLDLESIAGTNGRRSEADRLVGVRIVRKLRETYHRHLMTDPKARKVIIVENTYLPNYVKEHIARVLFDNLQIPSIAFTSSSLLALAASGRVTGLVVDVGWLETTVTPVYYSRPLYTLARSTPLAGRRLHSTLRTLIRHHAIYIPPSHSQDPLRQSKQEGLPPQVVTDQLVERILTEGCFVAGIMVESADQDMDVEQAAEDGMSEAERDDIRKARSFKARYGRSSSAQDMAFRITPSAKERRGIGAGTVIVPGWIRERAAEVLFSDDSEGEADSVTRVVLDCVLKLPMDLRQTMISSLLITGGTPSLPGFIPRLKVSLLRLLLPPPTTSPEPRSPLNTAASRAEETAQWKKRHEQPYSELYGLSGRLAIINDPATLDGDGTSQGGKGPRWTPSLMSWVGGSLAGALKTSSTEMTRETYDTLVATSIAQGEAYKENLRSSEVEVAAAVGISVEELRAGEALNDQSGSGRRRGWRETVGSMGDWSGSIRA
ncbi:hypothetical protein IAU60_005292 [Kwoniella sp. DSM 27419]